MILNRVTLQRAPFQGCFLVSFGICYWVYEFILCPLAKIGVWSLLEKSVDGYWLNMLRRIYSLN